MPIPCQLHSAKANVARGGPGGPYQSSRRNSMTGAMQAPVKQVALPNNKGQEGPSDDVFFQLVGREEAKDV